MATTAPCAPRRPRGRPRKFDRATALNQALSVFWNVGYEPATIGQLCAAMGINPGSLYGAFGNKSRLFLEAVRHYEARYWDPIWKALEEEPDAFEGIEQFFIESARILSSPDSPCGCMVILGATNVSSDAHEVHSALRLLREESEICFLRRIKRAVDDGQLPAGTDTTGIAATLNALLEGMSIQARDGATNIELEQIAKIAIRVIPQPA
jgi:AcrR family transcriptional regulator